MRTILSINFPDLPKQLVPHLLAGDFRLVLLQGIAEDSLFLPSQAAAVLIRFRDGLATAENICIEIKKRAPDMPLIVISPNTDTATKVRMLELGADDYVEEPFAPEELIARLRSVLRSRSVRATTGRTCSTDAR